MKAINHLLEKKIFTPFQLHAEMKVPARREFTPHLRKINVWKLFKF